MRPTPIPINILTGFLGAGKTTLLNALVKQGKLAGAVVLMNELGEIPLDHLLVEGIEGDMVLLASGCLCCSIRGELVYALEDLLRRRDNHRMRAFDRVLIETTGLADPAPVLEALISHPYLSLRFLIDSVVTVVDAVNGEATLDAHEEALRQVAVADRLIVTKADLADEGTVAALTRRLRRLNPVAPLTIGGGGEIAGGPLIDAGPAAGGKVPDITPWIDAGAVLGRADPARRRLAGGPGEGGRNLAMVAGRDEHHARPHGEGPGTSPHDDRIGVYCLTSDRPLKAKSLDLFLRLVRSFKASRMLRLKGIVALEDHPHEPIILHGAQRVVHEPLRLAKWPSEDRSTRVVLIAEDLAEEELRRIWAAVIGAPAPDLPDLEALCDNPLARRRGGLLA